MGVKHSQFVHRSFMAVNRHTVKDGILVYRFAWAIFDMVLFRDLIVINFNKYYILDRQKSHTFQLPIYRMEHQLKEYIKVLK